MIPARKGQKLSVLWRTGCLSVVIEEVKKDSLVPEYFDCHLKELELNYINSVELLRVVCLFFLRFYLFI